MKHSLIPLVVALVAAPAFAQSQTTPAAPHPRARAARPPDVRLDHGRRHAGRQRHELREVHGAPRSSRQLLPAAT
ncbi:MAG: hypothetical protein MZW92_40300 [Comamonadaceae bacterium]|nr:hypothetical protein [Comamonadaceae bacterium]